jgi:SAM-dependent methyltransferase
MTAHAAINPEGRMKVSAAPARTDAADPLLVRRVNGLYHELTHKTFNATHHCRHAVERPFWENVAHLVLAERHGRQRTVVDLACGTGFVSDVLRAYLDSGDQILDVDLNAAALAAIRRECDDAGPGPRTNCLTGSSDGLPLASTSVDLLALNAALHHFPKPVNALAEIDRVLKPGGYFALGFEPNLAHFASEILPVAAGCLARAAWYASPRENCRRLRQQLGIPEALSEEALVCSEINARLLTENLTDRPLSRREILDLVDPHARGDGIAGFDPLDLIGRAFPSYEVIELVSSDYLGEIPRRAPIFRRMVDGALRAVLPNHGSLFCWLLRKPETQEGAS